MHIALNAIKQHWPEYLIEAAGLAVFMIVAGSVATLLWYPQSVVHQAISSPVIWRALMGMAMGLTVVALVYSPWGKRSGAHFNPALTLAFLYVGKVKPWDAVFYIAAQFCGGLTGVLLVRLMLGDAFAEPPVSYIVTVPGSYGTTMAFLCEWIMSFMLMLLVLYCSNHARWARYTGVLCGLLIAIYVTVEVPVSGMSINPARTIASALPSGIWSAVWIYFVAPITGMFMAVHGYRLLTNKKHIACAKLNHGYVEECIFICSKSTSASMNR